MAFPTTFVTLQNAVIAKARLDATADAAKVRDWINQAYAQICVEAEVLVDVGTTTLTANTSTYDLSTTTQILRIKDLFISSQGTVYGPLRQISIDQMLRLRQSSGGVPPESGTADRYSLSGKNTLDLYPTPAFADTMTFYYVALPTALSSDSDVPVLQEPWPKVIEYGALVEAADFKADPSLDRYEQKYLEWKARFLTHMNLRRGQFGAFEYALDGVLPPHDPATIGWDWR